MYVSEDSLGVAAILLIMLVAGVSITGLMNAIQGNQQAQQQSSGSQ